jgi:large subunit ribosomal protein L10
MAITKQKKGEIIEKISAAVSDAVSVVFVKFSGLSVKDTSEMRKSLREGGVGYYVAKKTLIKRVLKENGYTGELPDMPGEIALAWSREDATAPARDIYAMGKKFKDTLTIVGGIWEGAFADATAMNAIATIPPVPVLRGMFVNVINSPIQGLVIALDQIAQKKAA